MALTNLPRVLGRFFHFFAPGHVVKQWCHFARGSGTTVTEVEEVCLFSARQLIGVANWIVTLVRLSWRLRRWFTFWPKGQTVKQRFTLIASVIGQSWELGRFSLFRPWPSCQTVVPIKTVPLARGRVWLCHRCQGYWGGFSTFLPLAILSNTRVSLRVALDGA